MKGFNSFLLHNFTDGNLTHQDAICHMGQDIPIPYASVHCWITLAFCTLTEERLTEVALSVSGIQPVLLKYLNSLFLLQVCLLRNCTHKAGTSMMPQIAYWWWGSVGLG